MIKKNCIGLYIHQALSRISLDTIHRPIYNVDIMRISYFNSEIRYLHKQPAMVDIWL